jgi:hypothetical protein
LSSDPEPFDLDRVLAQWRVPTTSSAPAALAPARVAARDPALLLADLERIASQTFDPILKEFALARDLPDSGGEVTAVTVLFDPLKVGALVRAMFPPEGPPPLAKDLAGSRDALARALDALEDVFDGLLLAVEARE